MPRRAGPSILPVAPPSRIVGSSAPRLLALVTPDSQRVVRRAARSAQRLDGERGTTYVLMGIPRERRGLRRLGEPLHDRLLKLLPGVDLRIVADRAEPRSP